MTDSDDKGTTDKTQEKVTDVGAPPSVKYDAAAITDFLASIFGDDLSAVPSVAAAGAVIGYTRPAPSVITKLDRATRPHACYFGTATMTPEAGNLRNLKANMKAMYLIVLDDIGTKIPLDAMPPELKPTYIIETSKGNFQWGFALEKPIADPVLASALVRLVYATDYTDGGGALANKLVRLPCGVNGKGDPAKQYFNVRLVHNEGEYWAPQALLDALGVGVSWQELEADPVGYMRDVMRVHTGAAEWSPMAQYDVTSAEGFIDEVAAFLYDKKRVKQEGVDWLTIRCPNGHLHSDPSQQDAFYSPLGAGEGRYRNLRTFNCFHDHCTGFGSENFLDWVVHEGGPQAAVYTPHPELITDYVYDVAADNFINVKKGDISGQFTNPLGRSAVNVIFNKGAKFCTGGKPETNVGAYKTWLYNPARVFTRGVGYKPDGPLLLGKYPNYQLNLFEMPKYPHKSAINGEKLGVFIRFIEYLVPDPDERAYFLDWMACKAQNLTFRGNAIVMVAAEEGTGRGTLSKIMGQLYGARNVYAAKFDDIINGSFNPHMRSLFVVSDETAMARGKNSSAAYEVLKGMIEPEPQNITINEKGQKQYQLIGGPSFLFFSNHTDALALYETSRRFYVITNPRLPRDAEGVYDHTIFAETYAWIAEGGWEADLWNWLRQRPVDQVAMAKPAPRTVGRDVMIDESRSPMTKVADMLFERWPSRLVNTTRLRDMATEIGIGIGLAGNVQTVARKMARDGSVAGRPIGVTDTFRSGTKIVRVRINKKYAHIAEGNATWVLEEIARAQAAEESQDWIALAEEVRDALDQ